MYVWLVGFYVCRLVGWFYVCMVGCMYVWLVLCIYVYVYVCIYVCICNEYVGNCVHVCDYRLQPTQSSLLIFFLTPKKYFNVSYYLHHYLKIIIIS